MLSVEVSVGGRDQGEKETVWCILQSRYLPQSSGNGICWISVPAYWVCSYTYKYGNFDYYKQKCQISIYIFYTKKAGTGCLCFHYGWKMSFIFFLSSFFSIHFIERYLLLNILSISELSWVELSVSLYIYIFIFLLFF